MSEDTGRLSGKTALITGAGTGIGAAVARRFTGEGGRVVLTGRRDKPLRETADPLGDRALAVPGDAADRADAEAAVAAAVERFGGLDVLVANAGGHRPGSVLGTDDDAWTYTIRSNLNTAFVTARACLPALIQRRGCIVVVASIAALFASPETAGYITTKHALIGLTRSLARDYGRHGVRVNALCPGWVRTPMADEEMDALGEMHGITRAAAYELATKDTLLGRPAEPEEIASVVAFLASADASIMTGAVIVADGGAGAVDLPTIAFDTPEGETAW